MSWLAATIDIPQGRSYRFGPDEPGESQLIDVSFETQIPGGFHSGNITIPRDPEVAPLETKRYLLAPVTIYGRGGDIAYQGRVADVAEISRDTLKLVLEGQSAQLQDDKTFRELYVDCDLQKWGEFSTDWKIHLSGLDWTVSDGSASEDSIGIPALMQTHGGGGQNISPYVANTYRSKVPIGLLYYTWETMNIDYTDGSYDWQTYLAQNDSVAADTDDSISLSFAASGTSTLATTTNDRYTANCFWFYATLSDWGTDYAIKWPCLVVYGNHGLDWQGEAGAYVGYGYFASSIIEDVVTRCTSLKIDTIEESTYVIRQANFSDAPTTAQEIIESVTAFGGGSSLINDWGVYEDGFFHTTPDTRGQVWRLRGDEGVEPQDEGATSVGRCNGVIVSYTDPAGTEYRVGPVGSEAEDESAELTDDDPANPYNMAGIRAWLPVSAGLTDLEGATLIGKLALLEANADHRRGTIAINGGATNDKGVTFPVWRVRAGDRIVIEDDREDTGPRRVLSTSYDGKDVLTATIGSVPNRLDALLARITTTTEAAHF